MIAPTDFVEHAPYMRKSFVCETKPAQAQIYLCALGWHELYVNGVKVDDRVLAPSVTQFDKHVSYIDYDVTHLLHAGKNAVTVLLGNGWYNCHTSEVWSFDKAPWRDWPKLICDIVADDVVIAKSDCSWVYHDSPIVFDALRNGESYDAREEIPNVFSEDFDDSSWLPATQTNPPGGLLVEEDLEPCKVMKVYTPVSCRELEPGLLVYDFGTNLTGWCEFTARGEAGAKISLLHSELVRNAEELIGNNLNAFILKGDFQTDYYTFKGGETETFHPHFTYHGFRYVCIRLPKDKNVEILSIEAHFIHTAFPVAGTFESSSDILNSLQKITLQSYLSNFTGIPTDCPHREKNGWTGDANMACETGLWNYSASRAYSHFIRMMLDTQRPSGQLPGIVPSGGWGYNWGSGPAWDSMLFEGCYQVYRFTGDDSLIREAYSGMKQYISYCTGMAEDHLIRFGLGDWCHWNEERIVPVEFTSTAYYYNNVQRMILFAKLLNYPEDVEYFTSLGKQIRTSFLRKFYHGNGIYSNGTMTALAAPLFFDLAENDQQQTADLLAEIVRKNNYKVDFGMLGAKYVPRVLASYGYMEEAFRLYTQEEFPGWGYMVRQGATTLWETWDGNSSQNHVLFSDVSAWLYEFLGGISPMVTAPGFQKVKLTPRFIPQVDWVKVSCQTVRGPLQVQYRKQQDGILYQVQLPENCEGLLSLPGQAEQSVSGSFELLLPNN